MPFANITLMHRRRIQTLCALASQAVLLWLAFAVFAPSAYAHEGHVHPHHAAVAWSLAADVSASSLPCGGDGGLCCCCDSTCCVSPSIARLPSALHAGFFLLPEGGEPAPTFDEKQSAPNTAPVLATAPPRAPPFFS